MASSGLEHNALQYGAERRRLRIFKMRGRSFRGGFHDFVIRKGGIILFPRLIASEHLDGKPPAEPLLSGINELDQLLGPGLDRGTSTLLMGPSGSGKSSIAMQFVMAALARGERALFVTFDETKAILMKRAAGMGWHLDQPVASGQLVLEQVDPAELSPGELTGMIRKRVEADNVRVVVLDSLSGYQNAMPAEQFMTGRRTRASTAAARPAGRVLQRLSRSHRRDRQTYERQSAPQQAVFLAGTLGQAGSGATHQSQPTACLTRTHANLNPRRFQSRPVRTMARASSSSLMAWRSDRRAAFLSPFAQATFNSLMC
ncbi:ATPase domain-containing protein [Bradyrhizobium sp. DASA03120]|uniref:ATPase domain-containing protein n=1 Tax=Bradyrhizobium sp. SMVTL-02 TaxID=3395917 RepID=UPI003F6FEE42